MHSSRLTCMCKLSRLLQPLLSCPADSDIDLGLFGYMHQVELEAITPQQAKKLLYSVLSSVHRAMLAQDNKVCCPEVGGGGAFHIERCVLGRAEEGCQTAWELRLELRLCLGCEPWLQWCMSACDAVCVLCAPTRAGPGGDGCTRACAQVQVCPVRP